MYRFWTGIKQSTTDVTTGLNITDNSFVGGWGDAPPNAVRSGMTAIGLSAAAAADIPDQNKEWVIKNNDISNVTVGLEIRFPSSGTLPASSMEGVDISENSIIAEFRCSALNRCFAVLNRAPVAVPVTNNWVSCSLRAARLSGHTAHAAEHPKLALPLRPSGTACFMPVFLCCGVCCLCCSGA